MTRRKDKNGVATDSDAGLAEEIKSALEGEWRTPVALQGLQRLSAGASQELWRFDAVTEQRIRTLILRRPPVHGVDPAYRTALNSAGPLEYELLQGLRGHGVKVPEVILRLEQASGADAQERVGGYIMQCLPGEGVPQRILNDDAYDQARARLPEQLAESIAAAHRVPVAALPPLATLGAAAQIPLFRQLADRFAIEHPGFEWAMRWLADHCPREVPSTLVHGDFRLGNFLVDSDGLSGIVDWEMAHLGDPMEDLAWLCIRSWRYSRPELPVAGLGSREDLFRAYENSTGTSIDPGRARYWEALGNVKWAALCLMQFSRYLYSENSGANIENAAIGRRFDEAMFDFFDVVDNWDI